MFTLAPRLALVVVGGVVISIVVVELQGIKVDAMAPLTMTMFTNNSFL